MNINDFSVTGAQQKAILCFHFDGLDVFSSWCEQNKSINPFLNKSGFFLRVCSTSLLKPLFTIRLDSYLSGLSTFKLSSANSFSLEVSKICRLGKGYDSKRQH